MDDKCKTRYSKSMNYKNIGLLTCATSIAAIMIAYISEYGFGLEPCPLCLYQRIPYALLAICGFALWQWNKPIFIPLIITLLSVEIGLAAYHMGIEYQWWQGLTSCSGSLKANTIEELRMQIASAPTARCDEPAFTFILSMAGWNMVYATSILTGILWLKKQNKP